MYNKIINPQTNKSVNINSVVGKSILKKYLHILLGGSRSLIPIQRTKPKPPNDRKFMMDAVKHNGKALEYASAALKDDREIVLEAAK